MFTALMLTTPGSGALNAGLAEDLCAKWGGGPLNWLARGEAVEFEVPTVPEDRWSVWEDCQTKDVDLIVIPTANRRKRLLIADMDSTMIQQECIDELADAAGVGDAVKAVTARAMNGEIDFVGALHQRVAQLKGQPASIIEDVLRDRITFMPGGKTLLATMKRDGAYAALVSGGFTAFTARVGETLGFDENRANTLNIADGMLDGTVALPVLGQQAKVDALAEITQRLGISSGDALAVGDGANDLGMLSEAGMGVALHAKPAVAAQCDIRINFGDLTALLYLQGYSRAEFAD